MSAAALAEACGSAPCADAACSCWAQRGVARQRTIARIQFVALLPIDPPELIIHDPTRRSSARHYLQIPRVLQSRYAGAAFRCPRSSGKGMPAAKGTGIGLPLPMPPNIKVIRPKLGTAASPNLEAGSTLFVFLEK